MTTATATPTTTTAAPQAPANPVNSVVAVYRHHSDAEEAIHRLDEEAKAGAFAYAPENSAA